MTEDRRVTGDGRVTEDRRVPEDERVTRDEKRVSGDGRVSSIGLPRTTFLVTSYSHCTHVTRTIYALLTDRYVHSPNIRHTH